MTRPSQPTVPAVEIVPVWMSPPRSVYVHIPFCTHRCGYCNFALMAGRGDLVPAFLSALERELELRLADAPRPLPIESLFLGGGTPTFLTRQQVDQLVTLLRRFLHWQPAPESCEWTVEANPNDLSPHVVQQWVAHGVRRFSLGAQSFQNHKLSILERSHRGQDIRQAAERVLASGATLSLDLIFATPGESLADWHDDLRQALACQPQHLSTYQLTYEKGTQFWNRRLKGQLPETDQDLALEQYQGAIAELTAAGWQHYEVSNFARPGFHSRHNVVYWTGRPYLAIGPGAASYVGGVRWVNHASTTGYIKRLLGGRLPTTEEDRDGADMRAREYFVFGMRLLAGIDPQVFLRETGFDLEILCGDSIDRHLDQGWFHWEQGRLRLTPAGLYLSDQLWPEYLGPPDHQGS